MAAIARSLVPILAALSAFGPITIDMYLPSLPRLAEEFHADTAAVQWTLSAYFLGLAIGQAVYGPIADKVGRRPPLFAGLAIYVAASVAIAFAGSIEMFVVMRFVQALGGCAGMVISRAIVRDHFGHQGAARMLSLLLLVVGAAPILAPLAGSGLLAVAGWRSIFWVLALYGAACLVAVAAGLKESLPPHLPRARLRHAAGAYLGLATDRRFVGPALAGCAAQAGLFAYISGSSFVFIGVYGATPAQYGLLFGIIAVGLITSHYLNRRVLETVRADRVLARGNVANAAFGLLILGAALTGAGGMWGLVVPLFGYVASLAFTFANAAAGAMAPFPERAGSASALFGTLQFGAAALAGGCVGAWHDGTPVPMAAVICFCGVAALVAQRTLVPAVAPGAERLP